MRIISSTTEDDMIATFLSGEYSSERFDDRIKEALRKHGTDEKVVIKPDLANREENSIRRRLLKEARGYGTGQSWFAGIPDDIRWYRAEFSQEELANIRYIIYDYWIELTNGSLRAADAVATIRSGTEIFRVSNQPFIDLSRAIAEGKQLPPMIFVGTAADDLVVLEGHNRLTAYLLAGNEAPKTLETIVGLSPHFTNWKMYSFEAYDRHR